MLDPTRNPLRLALLASLLPAFAAAQGHGPARPWSASLNAGSFSAVDLSTGNLTTVLPLFDQPRRGGPSASVSLVHNNDGVTWSTPESNLGEGWSISVQASLEGLTDAPGGLLVLGTGETVAFSGGVAESGYRLTLARNCPTGTGCAPAIVTDPRGNEMVFEELGGGRARILERRDAHGFALTYAYAANGLLASITDRHGRGVAFHDDDSDGQFDRVANTTPGVSREFDLTYDSAGRLQDVTSPENVTMSFGYLAGGEMDWVEDGGDDDGNGQNNRWSYDYAQGKVSKLHDPHPHTTSRAIAYSGTLATVTGRAGHVTTYEFDSDGNLFRITNALGDERTWQRNADRLVDQFIDEEQHTWLFEYDGLGNLERILDPAGIDRRATWDTSSRLTSISGADGTDLDLHYTHGSFSRWVSSIQYPADGFGNPAGTVTFTAYPPGHAQAGRLEKLTGLNGVDSTRQFGGLGETDETTLGDGHAHPVVTQFQWNAGAREVTAVTHVPGTSATPPGHPELPAPHPQLVGVPSRGATLLPNWAGEVERWTTTVDSGIHPLGAAGPEALASTVRESEFDFRGRAISMRVLDDQATVDTGGAGLDVTTTVTYHDGASPGFPHGGRVETNTLGETRTYQAGPGGQLSTFSSSTGVHEERSFYPDGMLESTTYGTGPSQTRVRYEYRPNNQRMAMAIEHSTDSGATWSEQRRMTSFHNAEGLIYANLETTGGAYSALTTYSYDTRKQLVHEKRIGQHPYNYAYAYDQGGNRTLTVVGDSSGAVLGFTEHVYDVSDPATWGSKANRLMLERTFDGSFNQVSTRWYYYDGTYGNVVEVVEGDVGSPVRRGTSIVYAGRPQDRVFASSARLILEREWIADAQGAVLPGTTVWNRAIELRQANLVERDAVIERDPVTLAKLPAHPGSYFTAQNLFDYEGQAGLVTILRNLIGFTSTVTASNEEHVAADIVGNGRWVFTPALGVTDDAVQTAFGVVVAQPGSGSRHTGFSGAVGGESGLLPHGWIRIGARILDPRSGRWLQSDPIGILGGFNTYEYSLNSPTRLNDPTGLQSPQPHYSSDGRDHWGSGFSFLPQSPSPTPQPLRTQDDLDDFEPSLDDPLFEPGFLEPEQPGGGGMTQIDPPFCGVDECDGLSLTEGSCLDLGFVIGPPPLESSSWLKKAKKVKVRIRRNARVRRPRWLEW